jgi:hypothetical protein
MRTILGANNAITKKEIINKWGLGVKVWLGYQKEPFPFVYNEAPHLKHVVIQWHIHIESLIFFMD